jgi:CHAT domain-containing protein
VIVTRWNVDSASTAVLLGSFFTHLHDGESISQAMYHARNDCRNMRNDYSHPYFWAGLELVGRTN